MFSLCLQVGTALDGIFYDFAHCTTWRPQTLKGLASSEYLTPLLGQRDQWGGEFMLSRHANPEYLLGFLSRWYPAQGW